MTTMDALRLMLYDETCGGRGPLPGLSASWRVGGWLYGKLGRLDAWCGASRWEEGLEWLLQRSEGTRIRELQYWGHGRWGCILMQRMMLDASALRPGHALYGRMTLLKARFSPDSLIWLRTCESFGTAE